MLFDKRKITSSPATESAPKSSSAALKVVEATGVDIEPEDLPRRRASVREGNRIRRSARKPSSRSSERKSSSRARSRHRSAHGNKCANVTLRTLFETFGNLRPVRELPGVTTPFTGRKLDIVIVRENVEDLYTGIEYMQTPGVAQALKIISRTRLRENRRARVRVRRRRAAASAFTARRKRTS